MKHSIAEDVESNCPTLEYQPRTIDNSGQALSFPVVQSWKIGI